MKPLLLLSVLAAPMLMSPCVVEEDAYYHRHHPYRPYRHEVVVDHGPRAVVVNRGSRGVVYYNDHHGRYYYRNHRRIYVTVY